MTQDYPRKAKSTDPLAADLQDLQSDGTGVELQSEAPGEPVTNEMLLNDMESPESWLTYNKGPEQAGYSPADLLTPDTIDSLSHEYTIDEYSGQQTQPLVVPSDPPVMYITHAAPQRVQAVNARTGETYWMFTYENEDLVGQVNLNRGAAVYGDHVYLASYDNHVLAIDRYNGEMQWKSTTLSERQREEMTRPDRMGCTQAPVVLDGTVLAGQSGVYGGWGAYSAFDAETGEEKWHQDVVPKDEWVGQTWRYGDSSPWNNAAIDPESGQIFIPTGNPGAIYAAYARPGPNKHSDSVIAMDVESGEVNWTYQLIAHDWSDYDTYNTRVVEMSVGGEQRRVVEAINKSGWLSFLDIETGELIERSEPYAQQGGEIPFLQWMPRGEENKASMYPSDRGATEWTPDAYSPDTGYVYVAANDHGRLYWWEPWEYNATNPEVNTGNPPGYGEKIEDLSDQPDIGSRMMAIDPSTGEEVWRLDYDVPMDLAQYPRSCGNTATGGNVVFGGSPDGKLVAANAETGEPLWVQNISDKFRGITAAPMTWVDPEEDTQYVAIASKDGIAVYGGGS